MFGNPSSLPVPLNQTQTDSSCLKYDAWKLEKMEWELLTNLPSEQTMANTLEVHIPQDDKQDELIWHPTRLGEFSVKSFYMLD